MSQRTKDDPKLYAEPRQVCSVCWTRFENGEPACPCVRRWLLWRLESYALAVFLWLAMPLLVFAAAFRFRWGEWPGWR